MIQLDISHLSYEQSTEALSHCLNPEVNIDCQVNFIADHGMSKVIRDFVGKIFDTYTINHPWKGRFVLITDELINNAIEHGSRAGDTDYCVIHAGKHEDGEFYISLEVHDTGRGKDAKDAERMESIRKEKLKVSDNGIYMNMRGRGLFHITEKLVDKLSFSESPQGGLAVKIEKHIGLQEQQLLKA